MRTRKLDEAIDAVSKVYCPHAIDVVGRARDVVASLEVSHPLSMPLVELSYGAAVAIDAGDFPRLFLMMHCARGSASTSQERRDADWRRGQTMPFSAGFDTRLRFDDGFVQKSVRLDVDRLETLCARWLGHPLDRPLRFALRPFSPEFEDLWQRTLAYVWSSTVGGRPLAGAAKAFLDEFVLTLLLHQHPHNYSAEITESPPVPVPGVIRRAERYIADHAEVPITVSDIAAGVGVSLRALQLGFRHWRDTSPNAYLRQVRLRLARDELLRSDQAADVTTVALRYGFSHLGRFSAHYRAEFGEAPSVTWRRGRSSSSRAAVR